MKVMNVSDVRVSTEGAKTYQPSEEAEGIRFPGRCRLAHCRPAPIPLRLLAGLVCGRAFGPESRLAAPAVSRFAFWVFVFFVLPLVALSAPGSPSPVTADVQPLTLRPRTHAPAFIDITLRSQSRALIEGALELQVFADGNELFRERIPDLALAPGSIRQRLLLPPPTGATMIEEVRLQFFARSGIYDLGRFPLTTLAPSSQRQYLIAICAVDTERGAGRSATWQALRPERLFLNTKSVRETPVTQPVWLVPEDFPTPMGLSTFDVVLLEGGALSTLAEKQLADLTTWVKAGGSMCVVAPRALESEHVTFLNQLAGTEETPQPFERMPDKTLAPPGLPGPARAGGPRIPAFLFYRAELGRFVYVPAPPASEADWAHLGWVKATHFLAHSNADKGAPPSGPFDPEFYQFRSGAMESWIMGAMPRNARMIPLPVVVAILGAFVLMVGPGEWLFLGWVRRRRWTWITFPVIAVGCTLFTVRAADYYLGGGDRRGAVVITDFSSQGRPLRENRFDLWFPNRNQIAVTDLQQALAVPCIPEYDSRVSINARRSFAPQGIRGLAPMEPTFAASLYQGRVPGRYSLSHPITQWTPYLQRTFTFVPRTAMPSLRWGAVQPLHLVSRDSTELAQKISAAIGANGWTVRVLRSRMRIGVCPESASEESMAGRLSLDARRQWVVALSPGGRVDMLDLLLDHGPDDWVVIADRQVGSEYQIQRCVYHRTNDLRVRTTAP